LSPSLSELLTVCPSGGAVIAAILALATAATTGTELAQRVLLYSGVGALIGTYLAFVVAIGDALAK
jgi:hypothetical protein